MLDRIVAMLTRLGRGGDAVGEETVEYGTGRIDADTDTDADPEEEPQTHGRQPGSSPGGTYRWYR